MRCRTSLWSAGAAAAFRFFPADAAVAPTLS